MIVNLQSTEILQLEAFQKELLAFPLESRESLLSLVMRYLSQERLSTRQFKVIRIDGKTRVLEFKIKDARGNWRAFAAQDKRRRIVFLYAFHKKSQELSEKDKNIIRKRITEI